MKKRLLAFALAATMMFSSVNIAFAEDTATAADDTVIAEETAVPDDIESDAAVENGSGGGGSAAADSDVVVDEIIDDEVEDLAEGDDEGPEGFVVDYPHTSVAPWTASVMGAIGNQQLLGYYTSADAAQLGGYTSLTKELIRDGDGNAKSAEAYEIRGTENSVYMRAGTTKNEDKVTVSQGDKGKIANTEEGVAFYYQPVSPSADFILKAKATVIGAGNNGNGQEGFGLIVRDKVIPNTDYKGYGYTYDDEIGVGRLQYSSSKIAQGKMQYAWGRANGEFLPKSDGKNLVSGDTIGPVPGSTLDLSIRKAGDIYTLTAGDEKWVVDDRDGTYNFTKDDADNIYVGLVVSRNAEIEYTDVSLEILPEVKDIELTSLPTKRDYRVDEPFDPTGLEIKANYVDGSTKTFTAADVDDYTLLGFDDENNKTFQNAGEREVTVAVGAGTATFTVNVTSLIVEKLTVTDLPVKLEYYPGSSFDPYGMSITAVLNDGQEKAFAYDDVELTMDGKPLTKDTIFTAADAGDHTVTVTYRKDDLNIDAGEASATFNLSVKASELDSLHILNYPNKSTIFTGQELNVGGLMVEAVYADGSTQLLSPDEYEITGFDSSVPNPELKLTVVYKNDPTKTATFTIAIQLTEPDSIDVKGYPRTTYSVGETFNANGLVIDVVYTDSSRKTLYGYNAYYKDAAGFFTIADNGTRVAVDDATGNAQDYYMDITGLDTSKEGTGVVSFMINKTKYPKCANYDFNVTVEKPVEYVWKAAMMGPSSTDLGTASITVTDAAGDAHTTNVDNAFGALPDVMVDGIIPNVSKVRLNTWEKAGKIATDQDGIAYYYTEVPADKNFEISANIEVNRYMAGPSDMSSDQKAKYDAAIAAGNSEIKAVDMARDGQEAFGIMARDTIQLAGGVVAGEYKGNAAKSAIVSADAAKLYYVFDSNRVCQGVYVTNAEAEAKRAELGGSAWIEVSDATMYEAQAISFGDVLKAANGQTYQPVKNDISAVAVSNVIIAGGVTDGTYPTDPSSSTYQKKADMNRINILVRSGVLDITGSGSTGKTYAVSSTDKIPESGDIYNVTLKKFNTGYQITTKVQNEDGTWGPAVTKFAYDSAYGTQDALMIQNKEKYYVGFFTCRWADINVSDIELHETDPSTDSEGEDTVKDTTTPKITVSSGTATTQTNYILSYKTNGSSSYNSAVTISLNGKRIFQGAVQQNKTMNEYPTLVPDSINTFTLVMYPNSADDTFSSYNTTITKHYVTHSSKLADKDTLYVSPDGLENAEGTREDPIDLETAIQFIKMGGTIIMLDGTYNLRNEVVGKLSIDEGRSSYAGHPTTIKADEGATPIIDLEKKYIGFEVDADYWVFSGLTIINSKDNEKAFGLGGDHCVVEYCTFHDNGTTAFQISRISGDASAINYWPSYNVIRSCEAFNNFDPSQNNADGFAAKLTVGYGNVFEDCISHHNADDGWDCYTKIGSGAIGASVLENCISYKQEHKLNADGSDDVTAGSGGNGFKLGGEDIYVKHYLKDCLTFENKGNGVDSNNNPAVKVRNVIAYNNMEHNFGLYGNPTNGIDLEGRPNNNSFTEDGRQYKYDYDLQGAVSAGLTKPDQIYTWNEPGYEMYANLTPIETENNYLKKSDNTPSQNVNGEVLDEATFFVSTNKFDSMSELQRYPRNPDGSFNHGTFLERTTEYKHNPEDIVILPDLNGGTGNVGGDRYRTEGTTVEPSPETPTGPSTIGGGGGGGGGGGSKKPATTTTAPTTTTPSTNDEATQGGSSAKTSPFIKETVKVTIGASEVEIGGQKFAIDAAPYIQKDSDSTLVPLRFVSTALLGGDMTKADDTSIVTWDPVAKAATIKVGDKTIVFTSGSNDIIIDGVATPMEYGVKAEIVDGRMYVPFRALGQALGIAVEWDAETKTASFIPPVVEEEPAVDSTAITKEAILKGAEALDSILAISADRAETLAGPSKKEYTEKCDKLATILQEAAYDMTDEQIAAASALLTGELLTYFTEDLPKLVSTVEETNAKIAELKDSLLNAAPAEAEAETAEPETAEATTVVE